MDLLTEIKYQSVEDVVGTDHEDLYWMLREKGKTEQEIVEL